MESRNPMEVQTHLKRDKIDKFSKPVDVVIFFSPYYPGSYAYRKKDKNVQQTHNAYTHEVV